MSQRKLTQAIQAIETSGALLVYPIKNAAEPASLWSKLYPRREMVWDWSEDADPRVADLWHLREELSSGGAVVYTKWFRGRATFFSKELFRALLKVLNAAELEERLDRGTDDLYHQLLDDSPQSAARLRDALDLRGKANEAPFNRQLKRLWERLLIVGYGEVDEGSYPALAMGATRLLFESLWDEAHELDAADAEATVARFMPSTSPFAKQLVRLKRSLKLDASAAPVKPSQPQGRAVRP
jgi:hypothetical protein